MKVITLQSSKGNGESTANGLTRSCLSMFEVVDGKECCTNGCKPLKLKWVDKMKGEKYRSRLVCREIKRAKNREEQLGP